MQLIEFINETSNVCNVKRQSVGNIKSYIYVVTYNKIYKKLKTQGTF